MQNKSQNEPYIPAEDTFFLEDIIKNEKGNKALDIGSGSGYLTKILKKSFSLVVGTDINFEVLKNQTYKTENLICCNGADALSCGFDLVICNMPYLATDSIIDPSTDGGYEGVEIPTKIIKSARNCLKPSGKFFFVTSSLSNYSKIMKCAEGEGLITKIIARKKLFFEELIIILAIKPNSSQ